MKSLDLKLISAGDTSAFSEIIECSNEILRTTLARYQAPAEELSDGTSADWFGTMGRCRESADAVTRAAQTLGIAASRELLFDDHFVTCFGPLDEMPSDTDLVLCRTWGQFDRELYRGEHSRSAQPFFGERRELAELLPSVGILFAAGAVSSRQVVHKPGLRANSPHLWLHTTPGELMTGRYEIGEAAPDAYPGLWWM